MKVGARAWAAVQAILAAAALSAITASAGGASSAVAVTPGPVVAWGANGNYSLGDGTNVDRYTPVRVSGLSNVIQLAGSGTGGGDASLALLADGTVRAWGYNAFGQLGDGTTTSRPTPVPVSGLVGVRAIAAGVYHGLALLSNGRVMAWGSNGSGQVGDGTTTTRLSPVPVRGISGAVAIAAGDAYSLAVLSNGTVMAWGANGNGQLGDGTTTDRLTPVPVSGLRGATAVAGGLDDSFALLSNGTVMAWGTNNVGQLGDGTTTDHLTPVPISGLSGVTAIAAGGGDGPHALALLSSGVVMAWGSNSIGELGDGTTTDRHAPVAVSGLHGATGISAGAVDSAALLANGTVMTWGGNAYGQLGDGTHSATFGGRPVPGPVSGLSGATAIDAGGTGYHMMAIAPGPVPPPVLGKSVDVAPVSGQVLVRLPASPKPAGEQAALTKGARFVPLTAARQLPAGTQIDARAGTLTLTAAQSTSHGKLQSATLGGALFSVTQSATGVTKGLTTFSLLEGAFPGAPTYSSCKTHAAGDTASQAAVSPTVLQTLHAHDKHGKWRTRGHNSSATTRGTVWDTVDRCDGTLTVVHRGTVDVYDFARRKTITVHAGHSYLAKRR